MAEKRYLHGKDVKLAADPQPKLYRYALIIVHRERRTLIDRAVFFFSLDDVELSATVAICWWWFGKAIVLCN